MGNLGNNRGVVVRHRSTSTKRLLIRTVLFSILLLFIFIHISQEYVVRIINRQLSLASSMSIITQLDSSWKCQQQSTTLPISSSSSSTSTQSYKLASDESFGFFTDVSDNDWMLMKEKNQDDGKSIFYNTTHPIDGINKLAIWMLNNVDPTFTCPHIRRVGGKGDGPKWTCDPHRLAYKQQQSDTCLIYSVGSRGNYKFEDGLLNIINKYSTTINNNINNNNSTSTRKNCEIHVFDPNPSFARVNDTIMNNIYYHPWGLISSYDKKKNIRFGTNFDFKTLPETLKLLGHEQRHIDIFKIDCEGCEFSTYKDWLHPTTATGAATIGQILVEVHPYLIVSHKWSNQTLINFFTDFSNNGYAIFSKEANTHPNAKPQGTVFEFGFIKLNQSFFKKKRGPI